MAYIKELLELFFSFFKKRGGEDILETSTEQLLIY